MPKIEEDLANFVAFVRERISEGDTNNLELAELFDLWMLQNQSEAQHANNAAAINASIGDFMNGERGSPAGKHSRELREGYGLKGEWTSPGCVSPSSRDLWVSCD